MSSLLIDNFKKDFIDLPFDWASIKNFKEIENSFISDKGIFTNVIVDLNKHIGFFIAKKINIKSLKDKGYLKDIENDEIVISTFYPLYSKINLKFQKILMKRNFEIAFRRNLKQNFIQFNSIKELIFNKIESFHLNINSKDYINNVKQISYQANEFDNRLKRYYKNEVIKTFKIK